MWRELFVIHPDCQEHFISTNEIGCLAANGVNLAGQSTLETSYRIGRVDPEYHTLVFTLSGKGKLSTEAGVQDILADTLALLPAKQPHLFELSDEPNWKTCWVLLANTPRWKFLLEQPAQLVPLSTDAVTMDLTLSLLTTEMEHDKPSQVMSELVGQTLLAYLDKVLDREPRLPRQHLRLKRLFDEVNRQLHMQWSVAELAGRMFISAPQFYRLCKQYYEMSPMQYVTKLRIQRAQDLLLHSNLSIRQVAMSVGYEDGLSFSHRFRKDTGVSPTEWRRQQISM